MMASRGTITSKVGTVAYMAPEILGIDEEDVDERDENVRESWYAADVYSFGVLMWEVLQGKVPFEGKSDAWIGINVVGKGRRPEPPLDASELTRRGFHCAGELVAMVEQCMDTDPGKRPRMDDVQGELGDMLREYSEFC